MKETGKVWAEAPATVANVGCGFDILGFALDEPSDQVGVEYNDSGEIKIVEISGGYCDLPYEINKNCAGYVVKMLADELGITRGVDIYLKKGIPPSSGIGSSAASSVAALYAANKLFGEPKTKKELVYYAMHGEQLISGALHADNVAPSMMGGMTISNSTPPVDIIELPVLDKVTAIIAHPHFELPTIKARAALPEKIPLGLAVKQWRNIAAFISAIYGKNYEKLDQYMQDYIVERARQNLIPGFLQVKEAALENGAIFCSISGGGPSVFAFSIIQENVENIGQTMEKAFLDNNLGCDIFISKINKIGAKII